MANVLGNSMATVWGELKRRNVVRVAIAYVVVSWLTLQLTDVLVPLLSLPEWVGRFVFLVLLIGFPLALFFAWAFELTPEGIKKEKHVDRSESVTHVTGRKLDFIIIGVLVVALTFFAVDKYVLVPSTTPASTVAKQSIAVLPFVNMSDDAGNEYFSDGLSEEILNLLAKIPELKVIARTSSFAFKGQTGDIRGIGQQLGVKTLLEGSVRKSGERVRITAQLIDVSDGSHIWSETYDRTITDIFAVQDDVAAAIIDALQIHVSANPARGRPTESAEAYALFLKARASLNAGGSRDAEKFVLSAIELDPEFAEAYELLAYCYWTLCGSGFEPAEGQKLAGEAAAKALAINPDLVFAQALYLSGNIETYSYLGEIEALERAVRQQPGNPALLVALSWDLLEAGYLPEALGAAERLVQLDPLSATANLILANALYAVGRTSESLAAQDLALQFGDDFAKWASGQVNLVEEQDDIAIAYFEAYLEQDALPSKWVRELVTGARDPATGQAYLDRHILQIVASTPETGGFSRQDNQAMWYLLFGFLDRYFEPILDLDLTDSAWTDADIPFYRGTVFRRSGFTAHPKYLEVAKSIGIIDVWEQRGPPDFCEKIGGEWVCE